MTCSFADDIARAQWLAADAKFSIFNTNKLVFGFCDKYAPPPADAHYTTQVHGVAAVMADAASAPLSSIRPAADALMTITPGTTVAVRTADCVPLLMSAAVDARHIVAAVHAGWRGLTAGVIAQAVTKMLNYGAKAQDILVAVGPRISAAHYQVGPEVLSALATALGQDAAVDIAACLSDHRGDKAHLDLGVAAFLLLRRLGVVPEHVAIVSRCTYDDQRLASYRRDGANAGRNWSFIGLR